MLDEAIRNNGNPEAMIKQMMSNATPEQKQSLLNQARNYGVPDNVLSRLQNIR